jgi:hypothetical protein
MSKRDWALPTKWRIVKIGVDFSADLGGGSFTNTYAIPDDGRDFMDITLGELRAYPSVSAMALLDEVVHEHRRARTGDGQ